MEKREKIISKAFGSVTINARSQAACTVMPPSTPYFEPKKCRIVCLDPRDPNTHYDLKIGAVSVGGSPQLAINELCPSEGSAGLRPEDIEYVNWSVFSTIGLARELQFNLYNPNDIQVAVFVCLDGWDVDSLDIYGPNCDAERTKEEVQRDIREMEEKDRARRKLWLEAERRQNSIDERGWQQVSGPEIDLEPLEQRVIKITPTVSPYFEPSRIRFHGHKRDGGEAVPFSIIDAFCMDRVMYGTSLDDLFSQRTVGRRTYVQETPLQLIDRLQSMVVTLTRYGKDGLAMREDSHMQALEDVRGMLTTHLVGEKGWGDVSWWPIFSTEGLKRELGIVAYNPWPFRIRASVSMEGNAMVTLVQESETTLEEDVPTGPQGSASSGGSSPAGANGPAGPLGLDMREVEMRKAARMTGPPKDDPVICPVCNKQRPTYDDIMAVRGAAEDSDIYKRVMGYNECCNEECKGTWGTGCWHCHDPKFLKGQPATT